MFGGWYCVEEESNEESEASSNSVGVCLVWVMHRRRRRQSMWADGVSS